MVIQRKQWTEDADEAFQLWEQGVPAWTSENAYRVIAFYGRLEVYRISPKCESLPAELFMVGFDELCKVVETLYGRALELALLADKLDPDDFQDKVELFIWSFHQFMGAWGYLYHNYTPTDPAAKLHSRDNFAIVADRYQALLTLLNSDGRGTELPDLTPVLIAAKQVLHEIQESLPRTSTARHWCYLRLKCMVDDAVATQLSL